MTLDDLRTVVAALERRGVEYVIIGGAALNAHGIVRATEDVDLMVRPTVQNVERLRAALADVWDDPAIAEITAEDLAGEYPAIRYGPPTGTFYLDIIARFGDRLSFDDLDSEYLDLGGCAARIATPAALVRMKSGTVRPIDHADAAALRGRFGLDHETE